MVLTVAWGNADNKIIHPAIMLQKRAIRIINNAPYNSHTEPKFRKSEILKLHDLHVYEFESLIVLHDYLTDKLLKSCQGIGICLTHEKRDNVIYCMSLNTIYVLRKNYLAISCLPYGMTGPN